MWKKKMSNRVHLGSRERPLPSQGLEAHSPNHSNSSLKLPSLSSALPKTHRGQTISPPSLIHITRKNKSSTMTVSDDESNGVFDIDEELVPVRELKQAGVMEVDFEGLLSTPLRLEEDLKKGCGGMLWPAGMVMAKYLIRQDKEMFRDKTMFVTLVECQERWSLGNDTC
jgi:hypothetical protein